MVLGQVFCSSWNDGEVLHIVFRGRTTRPLLVTRSNRGTGTTRCECPPVTRLPERPGTTTQPLRQSFLVLPVDRAVPVHRSGPSRRVSSCFRRDGTTSTTVEVFLHKHRSRSKERHRWFRLLKRHEVEYRSQECRRPEDTRNRSIEQRRK